MSSTKATRVSDAELVKRLREIPPLYRVRATHLRALTNAAADTIEALQAEVERLREIERRATVTEADVKACLDEYNDFAEMNTPETNMRAALETFAHRKALEGDQHEGGQQC